MRCRRCEEEGDKKEEDRGEVKDKDKQNIVGKRKVEEKNGKIINKNTFATTSKESSAKPMENHSGRESVIKDAAIHKLLTARSEDISEGRN